MKNKKFFVVASFVILAYGTFERTEFVFAETDLTAEQKAQKRQEFNASVAQQAAQATPAPALQKPWTLSISNNYGHDSNVTFDSKRKRDVFHQETIMGSVQYNHPSLNHLLGAGKFGVQGGFDYLNYSKQNESDYRNSKISPFVTFDLTKTLSLKSEYTFKNSSYRNDDHITYGSHELKVSLAEARIPMWLHKLYGSTAYNSYPHRKQLSASNTDLDGQRTDRHHEMGYDFTFFPSDKFVMGANAAYQLNDSNDLFQDTNDYVGCKTTGYIYLVLNDRMSWVGAAGYDFKDYGHKLLPTRLGTERDEFVYVANYLYFNLSSRTQFIVSYLFDQNYSNDPVLDFTGHIITAGVTVKI